MFVFFPGTIKTALPGMDREVKENYQVVIQAKDMAGQMGGLSGTTTVSITLSDVNDSPPRFANRETPFLFLYRFKTQLINDLCSASSVGLKTNISNTLAHHIVQTLMHAPHTHTHTGTSMNLQ